MHKIHDMQLFYAPGITLPRYTLPAEESAHAVRVLRLATGDQIFLTDGRGTLHRAVIIEADHKACVIEAVESTLQSPPGWSLTVGVAPTKNIDRFEWFLEKATEIGISRVIPLECARSERRVFKRDHSLRVITSAVKQSLTAWHPALDEMTPFAKAVAAPFDGVKLIAHCIDGTARRPIGECLQPGVPTMVLIGPEGDFSPQEVEAALGAGFIPVTLGEQRMRTETAALASVFAMHYLARG